MTNKMVRCHGCELEHPATQQDKFPDNGWVLPYSEFGYYGGFSDDIGVLLGNRPTQSWILCHDCVVKMLTALPLLGQFFHAGQHPCSGDVPCCNWAWNDDQIQTRYGHNGVWVDSKRSS